MCTPKAPVQSAIFPVAGLGTRFLPATKATPKELLPVIDTPLIQYAIDEARNAGIKRLIFVTNPQKAAIERHIRTDLNLVQMLRHRGKNQIAATMEGLEIDRSQHEVRFVTQPEPLGLGDAVSRAKNDVLPGPVAVLLPDDLILGPTNCLADMIDAYSTSPQGHMVATTQVPRSEVSSYGVLSVTQTDGPLSIATGIIEKPSSDAAPSCSAVVGRYILDPCIFETLTSIRPGAGGEIQLTDAIAADILNVGLTGFSFSGRRFDCGSKEGMLEATLSLAAAQPRYAHVLANFGIIHPMVAAE